MVNEGRCHVDHAGLCICPWNGAAAGSGAQGSPEQGHQERWGAGWQRLPGQLVMRDPAELETQDPGQG